MISRSAGDMTRFAFGLVVTDVLEDLDMENTFWNKRTRQPRQGTAGQYEAPASDPASSVSFQSIASGRNGPYPSKPPCTLDARIPAHHRGALWDADWGISCPLAQSCLSCVGPWRVAMMMRMMMLYSSRWCEKRKCGGRHTCETSSLSAFSFAASRHVLVHSTFALVLSAPLFFPLPFLLFSFSLVLSCRHPGGYFSTHGGKGPLRSFR